MAAETNRERHLLTWNSSCAILFTSAAVQLRCSRNAIVDTFTHGATTARPRPCHSYSHMTRDHKPYLGFLSISADCWIECLTYVNNASDRGNRDGWRSKERAEGGSHGWRLSYKLEFSTDSDKNSSADSAPAAFPGQVKLNIERTSKTKSTITCSAAERQRYPFTRKLGKGRVDRSIVHILL